MAIAVPLKRSFGQVGGATGYQSSTIVTLAILVSGGLVGSHLWNVARLGATRTALGRDLGEVPVDYRTNANPQLPILN